MPWLYYHDLIMMISKWFSSIQLSHRQVFTVGPTETSDEKQCMCKRFFFNFYSSNHYVLLANHSSKPYHHIGSGLLRVQKSANLGTIYWKRTFLGTFSCLSLFIWKVTYLNEIEEKERGNRKRNLHFLSHLHFLSAWLQQ